MSRTIIKKKGSTLMVALAGLVLTTTLLLLLAAPVAPVAQAQEGAQYGVQYPPGAEATDGSSGGEEELATLSFDTAVFGHGTPVTGGAVERFRAAVSS